MFWIGYATGIVSLILVSAIMVSAGGDKVQRSMMRFYNDLRKRKNEQQAKKKA